MFEEILERLNYNENEIKLIKKFIEKDLALVNEKDFLIILNHLIFGRNARCRFRANL